MTDQPVERKEDDNGSARETDASVPVAGREGRESTASSLDELRRLLVAPEQALLTEAARRIEALEKRPFDIRSEDVSEVLPDAVLHRGRTDERLAQALAPTIEKTLKLSVRRDPQPIVDAIFPAIGPAIRRAVAEALTSVMETVNRTLENSVSIRSLKWRFEALRSRRPLGEVILSHTLLYRVEQLFLVDRESGLPLVHVVADSVDSQDSALVSSMLTAIQDFVQDSFGTQKEEGLESLEVGDTMVWVEQGPSAILAAVIRGLPPRSLREHLQEIVESFHLYYQDELDQFDGDAAPFVGAQLMLAQGLVAEYEPSSSPRTVWRNRILIGLLLIAVALTAFVMIRRRLTWSDYLDRLRSEPGIVVAESGRKNGKWFVSGLLDPLAEDPLDLLPDRDIAPEEVASTWSAYQALEPAIIVRRARSVLRAPDSVRFTFRKGILYGAGSAKTAWIESAREKAGSIAGVDAYDDVAIEDLDLTALYAKASAVEEVSLLFVAGTARLQPGQQTVLERVVQEVAEIGERAALVDRQFRLRVAGYASAEGGTQSNQRISQLRAESVASALVAQGMPRSAVEAVGTGRQRFPGEDETESERQRNRTVTFHLVFE